MVLRLHSKDLLSKWGFEDGDILINRMYDKQFSEVIQVEHHDLLFEAVGRFMLPALRQRVCVRRIETSHNPVRAVMVDGVEIRWDGPNPGVDLFPRYVDVTYEQLYELVKELALKERNGKKRAFLRWKERQTHAPVVIVVPKDYDPVALAEGLCGLGAKLLSEQQ
jgi:hypothetical protein